MPLKAFTGNDPTTDSRNKPVVHLCSRDSADPSTKLWIENVEATLNRLNSSVYSAPKDDFQIKISSMEQCSKKAGHAWQGSACFGRIGEVFCNVNSLGRILHTAAWMSATYAVAQISWMSSPQNDRKPFTPVTIALSLVSASEISNEKLENEVQDLLITWAEFSPEEVSLIRATLNAIRELDLESHQNFKNDAESYGYRLYNTATSYVIGYIVGHELAHSYGRCIVHTPSASETSGVLSRLATIQSEGELLCPSPLLLAEINADKCALRNVTSINADMVEAATAESSEISQFVSLEILSQGRRVAIDLLEGVLDFGLDAKVEDSFNFTPLGSDKYRFTVSYPKRRLGYFYPPIRLFLFSDLLNGMEPKYKSFVRLCGDTANRTINSLTLATVFTDSPCKNEELLPKEDEWGHFVEPFGEFVPPKLKQAWITGDFEMPPSKNFSCQVTRNSFIEDELWVSMDLRDESVRQHFEENPHETVNVLSDMADDRYSKGNLDEAEDIFLIALPLYEELAKADRHTYQLKLAMTLNNLGLINDRLGRQEESLRYLERAFTITLEDIEQMNSLNSRWPLHMTYRLIQSTYYNIGRATNLDENESFVSTLEQLHNLLERLESDGFRFYGPYAEQTQHDVAKWNIYFADRYKEQGRLSRSIDIRKKAIRSLDRLAQQGTNASRYQSQICEQSVYVSESFLNLMHKEYHEDYEREGKLFLQEANSLSEKLFSLEGQLCRFQVKHLERGYSQAGYDTK